MFKSGRFYIGIFLTLTTFISFFAVVFNIIFPFKYGEYILKYSKENNLKPELVASLIYVESRFDKDAVSNKGAVGLMQIMPATAKCFYLGENEFSKDLLFIPKSNIQIGTKFIRYLFGFRKCILLTSLL